VASQRTLTVVFAMLSEAGHYAGTFRLARELRRRGHRVLYLGIADFSELVAAQGFDFVPFAAELLPRGYLKNFATSRSATRGSWPNRLRRRKSDEARFSDFLRYVTEGPLDERLRSCNPDVVLCDTFVWYVALRSLRLGLPTLDLSIILSLHPNAVIPPVTSSLRPRATLSSGVLVRASWTWLRLQFFFTKHLASLTLGRYRFPTRMHHLVGVFKRVARSSGYDLRENVTWWYGEMGPRLVLPEIVLCPRALQFPGGPQDRRLYLADSVDFERREEPLAAGALAEGRPLAYASLGSSAFHYPHAGRFFSTFIEASRRRPEWQFVLHLGDYPAASELPLGAQNLLVRERVPQLALLRKAAMMVTHGGLNSIRECIHFEVPMVIVPAMRDQPGNAVRARHRGIALIAEMSSITPHGLLAVMKRASEDAAIRRNLALLKREIEAEEGMDNAVRLIEATAAAARRGSG
jgi:zeaxanthin glucosyltransferase